MPSHQKRTDIPYLVDCRLQAQNGQLEKRFKTIELALKKSRMVGYIFLKANLLDALGRVQDTQNWYMKANKKVKDDLDLRLAEVKYLIKSNDPKQALDKLDLILKRWPNAEEALFIAGLTSIDLKRYAEAEKHLVELRNSGRYKMKPITILRSMRNAKSILKQQKPITVCSGSPFTRFTTQYD